MVSPTSQRKYIPGMYPGKERIPAEAAGQYIRALEKMSAKPAAKTPLRIEIPPTICFARKIGVGALEIADILAEKINYRVADRLIIEEMANNSALTDSTVAFFDERYPGGLAELAAFLFGQGSFTMTDYMRGLASVINALAMSEPTIFVGRGARLLLPRDRILSVHVICSRPYRVKRIARMMDISEVAADKKLEDLDKEQADFTKKLGGRRKPDPEEFDLLINCDHISNPEWAANIVAAALQSKFG
jgi:Cytidylate kinase-like family